MNNLCKKFNIQYPIIQAGMVWCSGSKLASTVSNSGALGLIGAGSLKPDLLDYHLNKMKTLTNKSFGVNIPIFSKYADEQIDLCLKHDVKIIFTSAGSPKKYTELLKEHGVYVVHVVPNPMLAIKCQDAGVDAVVAEGFEAGGHNGQDEITTLVLIPQVVDAVSIPVIAAGGIADGRTMLASMVLGAQAVQVGTRFAVTKESSAHNNYKKRIVNSTPGETKLLMKKLMPVRLMRNAFMDRVVELESKGANKDELIELLGKGRAKAAIFEGDLEEGEIEVGQISGMIKDIPSASDVVITMMKEFNQLKQSVPNL